MSKKGKKHHYHFNTKSLTFEKVKVSIKDKVSKVLFIGAAGLVFSAIVMLFAYNFFSSPKEKMLQREIDQYKLQYEVLNERFDRINAVLSDIENRDDNIYRTIFEAEPIPSSVREASYGGANRYAKFEGFDNSELIIKTTKKLDILSRKLYVQSKSYDEVLELAKSKTKMMSSIPAIVPIRNGAGKICSGFGYRLHPIYKTLQMHPGIDIISPRGTPIYATGDGIVQTPGGGRLSGYGICVVINHGYGYQTLYGHMSRKSVNEGAKVKRGQLIGYVGSTGMSTAPHLHYEVWKNGTKMNPVNYFYNDLSPDEYQKVLELSSKVTQSLS
ncbi:MAG: M23 family metallopeptidase [Bacteroidetes bacterium]|nr:M23 family metallopeptidase [Bacteroidota bacterium]